MPNMPPQALGLINAFMQFSTMAQSKAFQEAATNPTNPAHEKVKATLDWLQETLPLFEQHVVNCCRALKQSQFEVTEQDVMQQLGKSLFPTMFS